MGFEPTDESKVIINPDLPSDALSSKQFNTLIDVVSEGLIEGSATASKNSITDTTSTAYKNSFLKDIFLNKNQILQEGADVTNPEDSEFNYKNVTFDFRLGSSNQTFIGGINATEAENIIGTTVTTSAPVTHTVSSDTIDAVRVTVRFPSLQKFADNGDINGTEVNLLIKTIENDGTTKTVVDDNVKGRSTNPYLRDYLIKFTSSTSFPVAIRVERVTADSTEATLVNAFSFHTATNIIFEQNAYPNTAHVALRLNAEQFPRVPSRRFRLRGIKVLIPNNATVNLADGSLSYSGTWGGTFATDKAWTTDPAWILYDILTNTRYGCSIPTANLNKFTFKTVSEYCGFQVDAGNGDGSTEPRFALNVNITQRQTAFQLINDICSVMRVMPFYEAGGISIAQDAPSDPVYLFNYSNVTEDGFQYTGSSLKTRHTVINVSYFDMVTQDTDVETVEADSATQTKYGINVKNVVAFGTTSRNQARRFGKWFLYSEQNTGETCTFATTIAAGTLIRPSQIIEIADPVKAGTRRGGLVKSATSTVITLDDFANTNIPAVSESPTLSIVLPDGTLESKSISDVSQNVITVSSAFSQTPNPNAPYILETPTLQSSTWRVISINENDDKTFTIQALEHDSGKYNFVEDGQAMPTRNTSILTELLRPPSGLFAEEKIVEINNRAVSKIILDWQPVTGASSYRVQYRANNGDFVEITTSSTSVDILNTDTGDYEFRVFSYNAVGDPSPTPSTLNFNAIGKTAVPANVLNATLEPTGDNEARIRWQQTDDLDVKYGGQVYIRFSELTSGATFSNSTDVIEAVGGATTEATVPLKSGTYSLKFRDTGGRFSTTETQITVTVPSIGTNLSIISQRENPSFAGTKTNTTVASNNLKLTNPSTNLSGSYTFQNVLDLGGVFSLEVQRHIKSVGVNQSDLFDDIPDLDARDDFDGTVAEQTNASVLVRTTDDDPSGSPTFGSYNKFFKGVFKGRGFDFKCDIVSENANENILISELGFDAFLPARTEQSTTIKTSGTSSSGLNVSFDNAFFTGTSAIGGSTSAYPPAIMITSQNMATGDFYEITSITGSGFNIKFKNSSGTVISRNFSYSAVGYGKGG
tara:strand:+ start:2675 stop:5971 length:3297 start_codon:yes stop_codon:yes gene_type:complete